ncbi:MAG TPA: pilus assembly protein PilM [Cerasibacillus sp.]|uniref:type IV pilus biogenesis protein PilM n=1 Tax=Cerasibacillus sp. TaxID=2498711 RepID=UPI002F426A66
MFFFSKNKRTVNIVIEDYAIRIAENKNGDLKSIKLLEERPIPTGMIEHGKIIDEMAFFDWMKELIRELGLRHRRVRFYVPNSLVIMRHVEFPARLEGEDLRDYFYDQIGKTIHLPFQDALFDVYVPEQIKAASDTEAETEQKNKGILFAAPEEEVNKFINLFSDVSLQPEAVDIQSLGVYRYYYHLHERKQNAVSLFFELNLTSHHLSIFHKHTPEFIRHQELDINPGHWKAEQTENESIQWTFKKDKEELLGVIEDQITELDRIMDFYRYSLYKGEKNIDEIIVYGDYPRIEQVANRVKEQYDIPVKLLTGDLSEHDMVDIRYIPVLGLALKGGSHDAT